MNENSIKGISYNAIEDIKSEYGSISDDEASGIYIETVAYPIVEMVKQLIEHPETSFTCSDFIKNIEQTKNNTAYSLDENGEKINIAKKIGQITVFRNYLLSFHIARKNSPLVKSLVKHIYQLDYKLYQPVDPTKQKEFVVSFQALLNEIASSDFGQSEGYLQLIEIYLKINQGRY